MATVELDFNVSEVEMNEAAQFWHESVGADLNQIKSSQHPV